MKETQANELHRHGDPDTSVEAANSFDIPKAESSCYDLCKEKGAFGITNSEAARLLNKLPNATSPRWRPMVRKNLVADSGLRRVSVSSNRKEIVWVAV